MPKIYYPQQRGELFFLLNQWVAAKKHAKILTTDQTMKTTKKFTTRKNAFIVQETAQYQYLFS